MGYFWEKLLDTDKKNEHCSKYNRYVHAYYYRCLVVVPFNFLKKKQEIYWASEELVTEGSKIMTHEYKYACPEPQEERCSERKWDYIIDHYSPYERDTEIIYNDVNLVVGDVQLTRSTLKRTSCFVKDNVYQIHSILINLFPYTNVNIEKM